MSQGIRSPEAQVRQRITMTKLNHKNFLRKTEEKDQFYRDHLAALEEEHKALLSKSA